MEQWLIPALVSLAISLLGLWTGRQLRQSQADKTDAEAAETYTRTSLSLIAPLEKQIADLRAEMLVLHKEIDLLKKENETLRKQNNALRARIRELEK